ncbi:MAG: hypothetical protein A4E48_00794 [Methanosaeta sp. PtaU1.Bin060]|nr:MAG: hypothetical protein A4E48_00794 [Methanosaeta sp. PtaU1.Bin060]
MHDTPSRKKRREALKEARSWEAEARRAASLEKIPDEAREAMVEVRQKEADRLKAHAEELAEQARLEDLHVWELIRVKTSQKGTKNYTYWAASWREGGKVRNVYLGSTRRMSQEQAREKARKMKADSLSMKQPRQPGQRASHP